MKDELRSVLIKCREYVTYVNHHAEARHDDMYGDYYMDYGQYETMKDTRVLLDQIDKILVDIE